MFDESFGFLTLPQLLVPILYLCFDSRYFSILLLGDILFISDDSMTFFTLVKTHLFAMVGFIKLEVWLTF